MVRIQSTFAKYYPPNSEIHQNKNYHCTVIDYCFCRSGNYRGSDIATIAITIVIYYCDMSHYRYYRSALVIRG